MFLIQIQSSHMRRRGSINYHFLNLACVSHTNSVPQSYKKAKLSSIEYHFINSASFHTNPVQSDKKAKRSSINYHFINSTTVSHTDPIQSLIKKKKKKRKKLPWVSLQNALSVSHTNPVPSESKNKLQTAETTLLNIYDFPNSAGKIITENSKPR